MKTLPCDFCEATVEGETFDQWMENAKAHYGSTHADKLEAVTEEDREKWAAAAKEKFEAA